MTTIVWTDDFNGMFDLEKGVMSSIRVEISEGVVRSLNVIANLPMLLSSRQINAAAKALQEITERIDMLEARAEQVKQLAVGTPVECWFKDNTWEAHKFLGMSKSGGYAILGESLDVDGWFYMSPYRIRFAQPISRPSHGEPITPDKITDILTDIRPLQDGDAVTANGGVHRNKGMLARKFEEIAADEAHTPNRPFDLMERVKSFGDWDATPYSLWTMSDGDDYAIWSCAGDFAYCYARAQALPYRRERVGWVIYRSSDGLEVAKWERGDGAFHWAENRREELEDQNFKHGRVGFNYVHEVYRYGMVNRPAWDAAPVGWVDAGAHPDFTYGTVTYERELTPHEMYRYEMRLISPLPEMPLYPVGSKVRHVAKHETYEVTHDGYEHWIGDYPMPIGEDWRIVASWHKWALVPSEGE